MKNKMFVSLISIVGLFSLLFLWSGYQVKPLPDLMQTSDARGIRISSKVYDVDESKKYLNTDLLSRGYQPIQLTLHNQTATSFYVEGTNMEQTPTHEITRKITKSTIPRSLGYKAASLFFWPFAIPGTIDGMKTLRKHKRMNKDFAAKSIKQEKLAPYSTLNRVLFIRSEELKEELILTLSDENTGKLEEHKIRLA